MAIDQILLDMDGVISDFVTAALTVHDRLDAFENWPDGEWDIPTVLGISGSQFWKKIDARGHRFWSGLAPYSWTHELVDAIRGTAPFTILSSPSMHAECPTGKINWLREHLETGFHDFMFGRSKHLCAKPNAVLIDDSDINVDRFRTCGGHAILFPQRWNSNFHIDDRMAYVTDELRKLA